MNPSTSLTNTVQENWFNILLSVLALAVLVLFLFLIYQKITGDKLVAKLLPAENTIGYLTVDVRTDNGDFNDLNNLFLQTGSGSIWQQVASLSPQEYEREIQPWIGDKVTVAVLQGSGSVLPVVFVPFSDEEKMRNALLLGKEVKENYQGTDVYVFDKAYFTGVAVVLEHDLVLASDESLLTAIIDVQQGRKQSLYGTDRYEEIIKNLPSSAFVFYYLDYPKSILFLKQAWDFKKEYRDILQLFSPFEKDISCLGGAIQNRPSVQGRKGWYMKTVIMGAQNIFSPLSALFTGSDNSMIPEKAAFYVHIPQMFSFLNTVISVLGASSVESEIIVEGLINWWLQKNIASSLTFQDLLHLTTGDATILQSAAGGNESGRWLVVLSVRNEQETEQKMSEWFADFQKNSEWLYTPKIRDLVLPDETMGKEIYLDPKETMEKKESFHNASLHYIEVQGESLSPGYVVLDGKLYLFTHKTLLDTTATSTPSPLGRSSLQGKVSLPWLLLSLWPAEEGSWKQWWMNITGDLFFSLHFFDRGVVVEQLLLSSQ